MGLKKFFIQKSGTQFAVVAITEGGNVTTDAGSLSFVKGRFMMYVKDRKALEQRLFDLSTQVA